MWPQVRRSPGGLVAGATFTVLGFILNRLNVSVTGMERASGNQSKAARLLGVSRDTLRYRLKKHGLA